MDKGKRFGILFVPGQEKQIARHTSPETESSWLDA
jgi:hypothetical protein